MGKNPPMYTFQRPHKKRSLMPGNYGEIYTSTEGYGKREDEDTVNEVIDDIGDAAKYQKWTFYVMVFMVMVTFSSLVYAQIKDIPVRIKG